MGLSDTGFGAAYELRTADRHRTEDTRQITTLTTSLRHSKSEIKKWREKYEKERQARLALVEKIQEQGLDDLLLNH